MTARADERAPDRRHGASPASPLTAREAAELLGVHERTIRRAIDRGDLPAVKRAGVFQIDRTDLSRFQASVPPAPQETSPNPAPPTPFPQTQALSPFEIPRPRTPLFGRERELATILALLTREEAPLVTLTGPGGIGKTRLALEVAAQARDAYPGGVWFVDCSPLRDPDLVPGAILRALGIPDTAGSSTINRLVTVLGFRSVLLVLDNFEQVIAAGPQVAALLDACPSLRILVTSRAPLRLSTEQLVPVPSLTTARPGSAGSLAELQDAASVRIFSRKAKLVQPGFALTAKNIRTVADICVRLDGLPLAIELAAARSNVLSPQAMLTRLDHALPLLAQGPKDAPPRLRSMRDAIAWSYDLLNEAGQQIFQRLAVFVGGFTVDAATVVATPTGTTSIDALDALASLVENNLVTTIDSFDEPRFGMLETIREFALERLAASGEEAAVRGEHARWCLRLAERAEAASWGPEQRGRYDRLETDHDNVQEALAWLLDRAEETGLRLAAAMGPFWYVRGPLGEGRAWLDRALAVAASKTTPPALHARVLFAAGIVTQHQWDVSPSERLLDESVSLWREVGDERGLAEARFFRAISMYGSEALAQFEDVLARFQELAHPLATYAIMGVGWAAHEHGDDARAVTLLEDAYARFRQQGNLWGVGATAFRLAWVALGRGKTARAAAFALEALNLFWEDGDQTATIESLFCLASAIVSRQPLPGACLLAAANTAMERLSLAQDPQERIATDQALATARATLGEHEFAMAWKEGCSMSLEGAIAYANEAGSSPSAPHPPPAIARLGITPREVEVLCLLAEDRTDQEIADALFLSRRTVNTHVSHLLAKLGVANRREAITLARDEQVLTGCSALRP